MLGNGGESLSPGVLKNHRHVALRDTVSGHGGLGSEILEVFSNLNWFCNFMTESKLAAHCMTALTGCIWLSCYEATTTASCKGPQLQGSSPFSRGLQSEAPSL